MARLINSFLKRNNLNLKLRLKSEYLTSHRFFIRFIFRLKPTDKSREKPSKPRFDFPKMFGSLENGVSFPFTPKLTELLPFSGEYPPLLRVEECCPDLTTSTPLVSDPKIQFSIYHQFQTFQFLIILFSF